MSMDPAEGNQPHAQTGQLTGGVQVNAVAATQGEFSLGQATPLQLGAGTKSWAARPRGTTPPKDGNKGSKQGS